jgi:hypothetical protein
MRRKIYLFLGVAVLVLSANSRVFADFVISGGNITTSEDNKYLTYGADKTVDWSGMSGSFPALTHDATWQNMWNYGGGGPAHPGTTAGASWVKYEFDQVYTLSELWVWNFNYPSDLDQGLQKVYIEYTSDGSTWTKVYDDANDYWIFAQADGTTTYVHNTTVDFGGVDANAVVITAASTGGNWGDPSYYGLSEVLFLAIDTDPNANNPIPKDDGIASPYITLQWTAGVGASSHDVYFGTSYSAVADANTSSPEFKGNQTETSYNPPGTLNTGITYYWRIDERDTYYKGPVWSFTIGELIAHWKMDEGVGTTAYDTSGYGTAADAAFAGDPCWVSGYTGEAGDYALDFNGVADYLDCTFSSKFNLTEDQVSIAAWVDQGTGGTVFQDILALMDVGYSLYTNDGMPTMSVGSGYARWTGSVIGGGWHHLVGVVDDTHIRIFVDGAELDSTTKTQTLETPSALYIGGVVAWNDYFDGVIDDVRVYNYGLEADEVFDLYGNDWICASPPPMDFNYDCVVDVEDLAEFCLGWLECGRWPEDRCP